MATGPGLAPCLGVGLQFATQLARSATLPLYGIHHLDSHVNIALLQYPQIRYPLLALIISGGHTELWHVHSYGHITVLGNTVDDAVGETYDKVTRLLQCTVKEQESFGACLERVAAEYTASHQAVLEPRTDSFAWMSHLPFKFKFPLHHSLSFQRNEMKQKQAEAANTTLSSDSRMFSACDFSFSGLKTAVSRYVEKIHAKQWVKQGGVFAAE